ncbi:MAG: MFS transporter, partial [Actinomycetota bacterium]
GAARDQGLVDRAVSRGVGGAERADATYTRPTIGAPAARSDAAVIGFLAFIGVLMAYGIDAALPAYDELGADFDLDDRGVSPAIVGTPYFVGAAIGQLGFGVAADRFGRRSTLLVGFAVYGLAAVGSAVADELWLLLGARFMWGIGAAAPSVLRFAIARDLYEGDRLARVISTFSAVFLLGPIFVPFAGEAIVAVGSWRTVFVVAVPPAAIAMVWTSAFGETLAPKHRRPLQVAPIVEGFRAVVRTRVTRWVVVSQVFIAGSFFIWLGSAQPIIDVVYDRDDQFTIFFGLSGAGMALALLFNNRLIDRFGTRRMVRLASTGFVTVTAIGLIVTLATDGTPSFALWFGWAILANACSMVIGPMSASLALEPMEDKAGTASALLGVAQFGLGALLAAVVDAQVGSTVTPMLVGSLVYGLISLAALLVALAALSESELSHSAAGSEARPSGARPPGLASSAARLDT